MTPLKTHQKTDVGRKVRRAAGFVILAVLSGAVAFKIALAAGSTAIPPALQWAYPSASPHTPELKTPAGVYVTPNGKRKLTAAQVDALTPKDGDWFPNSHPTPPAVITTQGPNGAAPCAECHMINGQGVASVPDIAGVSAGYLFGELKSFRSGARTSSQPGRLATAVMIRVAKSWTEADLRKAVAYYASLPRRTPTQIVETDTAPAMRIERFGWTYVDTSHPRKLPLNGTVAEAPESIVKVFMYDPSNHQLVYVSKSTLMLGEKLVRTGDGGGQPCTSCHGADLRGGPVAPPLAGRDPAYLARQLWDIRSGARSGALVAAMRGPANGLSPSDVTAVSAYIGSQAP